MPHESVPISQKVHLDIRVPKHGHLPTVLASLKTEPSLARHGKARVAERVRPSLHRRPPIFPEGASRAPTWRPWLKYWPRQMGCQFVQLSPTNTQIFR